MQVSQLLRRQPLQPDLFKRAVVLPGGGDVGRRPEQAVLLDPAPPLGGCLVAGPGRHLDRLDAGGHGPDDKDAILHLVKQRGGGRAVGSGVGGGGPLLALLQLSNISIKN